MAWWEFRVAGEGLDECVYESTSDARREAENYHRVVEASKPAMAQYRWTLDGGEQRLEARNSFQEWWEATDITVAPVREPA